MSTSLVALGAAGAVANGLISVFLRPKRAIGLIIPDVVTQERHIDRLAITRHPVEKSALITDHAYIEPFGVNIHASWSNSSYGAVGALLKTGDVLGALSDGVFGNTYVQQIYSKLRQLQQSRTPFDLVTGKRKYTNMLIAGISVTTDSSSEYALNAIIECTQVILVSTQATTLPPIKYQRDAPITATPLDKGVTPPTKVDGASGLNQLLKGVF